MVAPSERFAFLTYSSADINFNERRLISQPVLGKGTTRLLVPFLVDHGFTCSDDSVITSASVLRLIPVSKDHSGKNLQRLLTGYERTKETYEAST